jgi:hypothetical protein
LALSEEGLRVAFRFMQRALRGARYAWVIRSDMVWALAATGLTVAAGLPAQADVASEPQAIFAAARAAWAFTAYPHYANYAVVVRYRNGAVSITRRYDTLEDLRRSIVFAQTFSREETANPSFPPHGVNFGIMGMTLNAAQPDDPIGPLALAITYDFGISLAARKTHVAQMGSEITAPAQFPVIGRSGTSARNYDVRLIEMLEGGNTYHLGLTPLRDPNTFRLREMWVTTRSFITQKILIAQNFAREPYTNVPWLVTFNHVDGGPYISEERAQGALDFGAAGSLEDVTIGFEEVRATSALPRYGTVGMHADEAQFVTEPE